MDVGATVVAHQQTAELMEPGEAALHDPALGAEAGTVLAARRPVTGVMPRARNLRR